MGHTASKVNTTGTRRSEDRILTLAQPRVARVSMREDPLRPAQPKDPLWHTLLTFPLFILRN